MSFVLELKRMRFEMKLYLRSIFLVGLNTSMMSNKVSTT